jgi:uncharacterized protein (DUF4213/DUF364 family)
MDLNTELYGYARDCFPERLVIDLRIGLRYTAVLLEGGFCGVAYTFFREGNCLSFPWQRPLVGQTTTKLLGMLGSSDLVETAVGLATLNALANHSVPTMSSGDILDNLSLQPDDCVAMVGLFEPLVPVIRNKVRRLVIFERSQGAGFLPPEEMGGVLPDCQVVLVTATTLINRTFGEILERARGCREVALLGPSTPLLPDYFFPRGVTLLSGIMVERSAELLRVVSEAGGTPHFMPFARKVNFFPGKIAQKKCMD